MRLRQQCKRNKTTLRCPVANAIIEPNVAFRTKNVHAAQGVPSDPVVALVGVTKTSKNARPSLCWIVLGSFSVV